MTTLNFVRGATPLAGWRLAVLALGVLMLLPSGFNWIMQRQAVDRLQTRLDAQSAASTPQHAALPALAPAQQHDLDSRNRAVVEAVRQLNLPVARLLKTIQAPPDIHVALLGLDLNSQPPQDGEAAPGVPAGALKISAEAETAEDMINYLAFLNEQRIFRSVYLLKHEMAAGSLSGDRSDRVRPYHFQLEAQWRQ